MRRCPLPTLELREATAERYYLEGIYSFGHDLGHLGLRARAKAMATIFLFDSFEEKGDPFGQEIEGWNSSCPSFMPGGRSHTHGFCEKIHPPPKQFHPPENPEPRPGGQPPHVHKPHVHQPVPRVPYELPAQTLRQEQKLLAQQTRQPQVPFTGNAPEETQTTRAIAKAVKQQKDVKHKQIEPPFVSPEAGEDVSPSPFPKPQVEVDPVKPRPPLIVRPKTSPAESNSEIGIVEDDPSPEEELLAADPEAAKLFDQLTEERVKIEERKELKKMFVPQNPPGTPKEEPSWPPSGGIAPPTQPIPARPGEANYNYGWTPPERRIPYSPPWPGGGPVTGVDRVEAVAAEVGNEASDLAHAAEDVLLNTTM